MRAMGTCIGTGGSCVPWVRALVQAAHACHERYRRLMRAMCGTGGSCVPLVVQAAHACPGYVCWYRRLMRALGTCSGTCWRGQPGTRYGCRPGNTLRHLSVNVYARVFAYINIYMYMYTRHRYTVHKRHRHIADTPTAPH